MPATLATVDNILKEVYEGQINDQLASERVLIKRIERTAENITDNIGGKYTVFPVRSGRNQGISYRAEGTLMAGAGQQGYKRATERLMYGYGRVKATGQLMRLAESNKQAFASAIDREMDGIKDDIGRDENRIAWGHPDQATLGVTGILAKLTSSPAAATTFTVDDSLWLEVGMIIDIMNSTGPAVSVSAAEISNINGNTITVLAAITSTSGFYVCRNGNYNLEPWGVSNLVSATGALHGLNPAVASESFWKSQQDNTTTTLTELAMITMCDAIRKACGESISVIFTSLGVRRAYWNIQTGLRRYNEPKKFDGGLTGLSFMYGAQDIGLVEDPMAPAKHMVMLTEDEIKIFRDKDWYWEDLDGGIFKWESGYDRFEAYMKQYWQMGTHKRAAHGKFTNLTEV